MRRALLTASVAAAPAHVGNPPAQQTGNTAINAGAVTRTTVNLSDPADATGTLTTVTLRTGEGAATRDGHVMVGTVSGSTFTVRAITPLITFTSSTGVATATISLPVVVGDYIGLWTNNSLANGWVRMTATTATGPQLGYNASGPTSAPSPGATISLSTENNRRLNLYAES